MGAMIGSQRTPWHYCPEKLKSTLFGKPKLPTERPARPTRISPVVYNRRAYDSLKLFRYVATDGLFRQQEHEIAYFLIAPLVHHGLPLCHVGLAWASGRGDPPLVTGDAVPAAQLTSGPVHAVAPSLKVVPGQEPTFASLASTPVSQSSGITEVCRRLQNYHLAQR
jgi:hypothetical protein